MRKLNIEVEAVVALPVKVKLGLLVRADDDANLETVIKQFAKGNLRTNKADVEDVEIVAVEYQDDVDADEPLPAHVSHLIEGGGKITVVGSRVTDSR
jgi:hypothetical protein